MSVLSRFAYPSKKKAKISSSPVLSSVSIDQQVPSLQQQILKELEEDHELWEFDINQIDFDQLDLDVPLATSACSAAPSSSTVAQSLRPDNVNKHGRGTSTILQYADIGGRIDQGLIDKLCSFITTHHPAVIGKSVLQTQTKPSRFKQYHVIFFYPPIDCLALIIFMVDHPDFSADIVKYSPTVNESFAIACHQLIQQALARPISFENITVSLFFSSLPSIPGTVQTDFASLLLAKSMESGLMCCYGTITSLSTPDFRKVTSLLRCKDMKCRDPSSIHVRHFQDKSHQQLVKRSSTGKRLSLSISTRLHQVDRQCTSCGNVMVESALDGLSELSQDCQVTMPSSSTSLPISTLLTGPLVNKVEVGDRVCITAKPLQYYDYSKLSLNLVVQTLEVTKIVASSEVQPEGIETLESLLPRYLPAFQVSAILVSLLGATVTSPSVWRRLKLSLLLSLVSICEDDPDQSFPLHVLIASDLNEPVLIRLLESCATLKRSRCWLTLPDPKELVQTNPKKSAILFPPESVKDGILIAKFTSSNAKAKVKRAIEAITCKGFQEDVSVKDVPFHWNCAFWLLDENGEGVPPRSNVSTHAHQLMDATVQVSKRFDLVSKPETDEITQQTLSFDLLLQQTLSDSEMRKIQEHESSVASLLRYFLNKVARISVRIPTEIVDFISRYQACLRLSTSFDHTLISLEELVAILEKLSKSHARLCKRSLVQIEDAVVAIFLLENSLWIQFGAGLVGRFDRAEGDDGTEVEDADVAMLNAFQDQLMEVMQVLD